MRRALSLGAWLGSLLLAGCHSSHPGGTADAAPEADSGTRYDAGLSPYDARVDGGTSNADSAAPPECRQYGQEWICRDPFDCHYLGVNATQLEGGLYICDRGGCSSSNSEDSDDGYVCEARDGPNVFCVRGGISAFCVEQSYCVEGFRVGSDEPYLCRDSLNQPVLSVPPDVPCPPGERDPVFGLCDGSCPTNCMGFYCMARSGTRSIGLCGFNNMRCGRGVDEFTSEGECQYRMLLDPSFRCTCAVMPEDLLGFFTEAATCLAYRSVYPDVECHDLRTWESL